MLKLSSINEENSHLRGTKHTLPEKLVKHYQDILYKYIQHYNTAGYKKAAHVIENKGVVTMEWLKGMKSFFKKYENSSNIEYILGGGDLAKIYVDNKLDQLTKSTPKTRKTHTKSAVKPLAPSDNLSGHRSQKSSPALSMVNSLMNNIMPKLQTSSNEKTIEGNTFIIKEEQLKNVLIYLLENK